MAFETVVEAAKEMKARLEELGSYNLLQDHGWQGTTCCHTTDSERKRPVGWKEAKAFAQTVCSRMANDSPNRYLIVMTKKLRTGRIFLDYLRNDRTATAVAPLSPRARPGAPVSMPLNWSQVKAGLDPQRFTLRTASALLTKGKPWRDYCAGEQELKKSDREACGNQVVPTMAPSAP